MCVVSHPRACFEMDLAKLEQPEEPWRLAGRTGRVCGWVASRSICVQCPGLLAVPGVHPRPGPPVCLASSRPAVRAWYTSCFLRETPSHLGWELLLALGSAQLRCEVVSWSGFTAARHKQPHSGPQGVIPRSHQNGKWGQVLDSRPVNPDYRPLFTPPVRCPVRPLSCLSLSFISLETTCFSPWAVAVHFAGRRAGELGGLGAGQEQCLVPGGTSDSVLS